MEKTEKEKIGGLIVEEVVFDQTLYEKNLKENNFSVKETYAGKDGKGADK